jgi:regulatory protein
MAALDTEEGLYAAARRYLERFTSSRKNLRRVLENKARRALGEGLDKAVFADAVDRALDRVTRERLIDDVLYAKLLARSLHRRGMPARAIAQRLRQKGVDAELVGDALGALREEVEDSDFVAACRFARRRRLGPFRTEGRVDKRTKDLASLGRAGFSYDLARRVVDAESSDDLSFGD